MQGTIFKRLSWESAFAITQIPFAFEYNQLNGNLADWWSTHLQFSHFWKKTNIYSFHVYYQITIWSIYTNLYLLSFTKIDCIAIRLITLKLNANGIWGILGTRQRCIVWSTEPNANTDWTLTWQFMTQLRSTAQNRDTSHLRQPSNRTICLRSCLASALEFSRMESVATSDSVRT